MLKVYLYIALRASMADNNLCKTGECCVSWSKMAHDTGMSVKSARNAVRRLEKNALIGRYERGLKKANVYAIVPIESMQKSLPSPGKEKDKDLGKENPRNFNMFLDIAGKEKDKEKGNRYENIHNSCAVAGATAQLSEEKEEEDDGDMYTDYVPPWRAKS